MYLKITGGRDFETVSKQQFEHQYIASLVDLKLYVKLKIFSLISVFRRKSRHIN